MVFLAGLIVFIGNIFNRFLIHYKSVREVSIMGIYAILAVSFLMVIGAYIWPINLYTFLVPIIVILFFGTFVLPNCIAEVLQFFPKKAGAASAVIGVLLILTTGIVSAFASFLKSTTSIPISWAYVVLAIACYLIFTLLLSRKSKNETQEIS